MADPAAQAAHRGTRAVSDATLRHFLGYNLKRAFNVVQADLNRALALHDLRMLTYSALVLIVDNPGLRQSQLADAMDIERPNLVAIVDSLEQRGLVRRDRVPGDRRANALAATDRGQRLCLCAVADVRQHEDALFAALDAEARALIVTALQTVQARPGKGLAP